MENRNNYCSHIYAYNGVEYDVVENAEVHDLLQKDTVFCTAYFSKNLSAVEDDVSDKQVHKSLNVQAIDSDDCSEKHFSWSRKATKLLVASYRERKEQFRDPKVRKKTLWKEIVAKFSQLGYNVTEDILDRKMRNMKKTFRTIRDSNRMKSCTGRRRINWEYYNTFQEIFSEDKTCSTGSTLSTMNCCSSSVSSSVALPPSISLAGKAYFIEPVSCTKVLDDNSFVELDSTNNSSIPLLNAISPSTSDECSPPQTSSNSPQNTSTRSIKSKFLYDIRKKLLNIENKRLESIEKLRQSIESSNEHQKESNRIQQERNEVLKKIIENLANK